MSAYGFTIEPAESAAPRWIPLIISVILGATAGMAINAVQSCPTYGGSAARVGTLKTFFIIVLIIAVLAFLWSLWPTFAYFLHRGGNAASAVHVQPTTLNPLTAAQAQNVQNAQNALLARANALQGVRMQ